MEPPDKRESRPSERPRPLSLRWPRTDARDGTRPSLRILVCDDERHIVRLIQVNLEHRGHVVITAFDGREALEKIHSEKPDLCVLDITMPYYDGLDVLRRIRKDPETMDIPVVLLTTDAADESVEEGYEAGADLYLTKPFDPAALIDFVNGK